MAQRTKEEAKLRTEVVAYCDGDDGDDDDDDDDDEEMKPRARGQGSERGILWTERVWMRWTLLVQGTEDSAVRRCEVLGEWVRERERESEQQMK